MKALLNSKIMIPAFVLLLTLTACQSTGKRLQKENPNSVFLWMDVSIAESQSSSRVLSFFSEENCRTSSLDSKTLLICPKESSVYMDALEREGILGKEEENFYILKSPDGIKRVNGTLPAIQKFEEGNIEESLVLIQKEENKNQSEFVAVKETIEAKITRNSQELVKILTTMRESDELDPSLERRFLGKFSPYYMKEESVSKAVDEFLTLYAIPNETVCSVETKEPNSPAFVMFGFEEPVLGQLSCEDKLTKRVVVGIAGNQYLKIGNHFQNREEVAVEGQEEFSYSVNGLSQSREENQVVYSVLPWYHSAIEALKSTGQTFPFNIRLSENGYAFQNVPSSFSPEYDRWEREYAGGRFEIGTIRNGKISATLTSDGKFTMGGQNANGEYDLMYGHPNGRFADGIWSSFTAVKVGEEVFNLHSFPHEVVEKGEKRVETSTRIGETGIRVHTIWEISPGTKDGLDLSYRIVNTGSSKQSVGVRVFMDTWAGYSDGVPFALPGHKEFRDRVITEEISFNPHISTTWETTDFHSEGNVFLQNQLAGSDLTPPDEVQLLNWGSGFGNLWDYDVSESRSVTGDSAAALVWLPREIPGKKELLRRTRFLSIERGEGYSFQLDSDVSSSGILTVNKDFGNCDSLHLAFSQAEGRPLTRDGQSEARFNLRQGQRSTLQIPLTLSGMGDSTLEIRETCEGLVKTTRLNVTLPTEDFATQIPLAPKESDIPVQFTSKSAGRKIEARLVDPSDGSVLAKTSLREEKQGDLFLYKGSLRSSQEGGFTIEYLDMDEKPTPAVYPSAENREPSESTQSLPKKRPQVRPTEVDLPKGYARITLRSGAIKEGKIISDSLEEICIQVAAGEESFTKRDLKSVRYGR